MRKIALVVLCCAMQLSAASYYVTLSGLGGEPEYDTQFAKWAADLEHQLKANGPDAHLITLSGSGATRAEVLRCFSRLASEMQPTDSIALFLIGHGSFDGTDYKFNLPGPDMSARELAAQLNKLPATQQLVVNMTSCSGASAAALAKKERIVITATKSGTEKNAPVFARYWVDALRDPAADTDKNGSISALEAFRYADRKTTAYFEAEKLLATEHALLTDNGKSNGVRDPKAENGQGLLAAAFPLLRPPSEASGNTSPDKRRLLTKKQDLEARIDRLKYQKAALPEDDYKKQLTGLLLELARTQAEMDR